MLTQRRFSNGIFTLRNALLSIIMAILIVGIVTLIFFLTAAAREKEDSLSNSNALPIHQNKSFPFKHPVWADPVIDSQGKSRCPKLYFQCKSSTRCLLLDKRCDGFVDCPKAEDELDCVCAFRMPAVKFCDKYPDCFDESDESFCSYCPEGSFNCGNGQCVPRKKVCDSEVNCDNFMDENFCFRLSSNPAIAGADDFDPLNITSRGKSNKSGFLLRNKNGIWYPVCANPNDYMQDAMTAFACVSITSNPLARSTQQFRRFGPHQDIYSNYIYHHFGRFVEWRGCLTYSGIFVTCSDVRCGFNPQQLLPKKPKGRIVGGELAEPGAWPWHAAVYKNGTYLCGATLISNRWLVSAAHCFLNHNHNYYEIQLGMLRRRSFTPHQKTYVVDRVVPHPKFNIVNLEYDIVMLSVAEQVVYDFWVRPICLPDARRVETTGSFCTAIGWGDTSETSDDSDDLLEVHVPITKSCRRNLDRWLCAGYVEGGKDACQGDSGGPLMCLQEDGISWYIAGVISGGTGCARPNTPGMYTRVVYFLDWINKVMASMGNDTKSPLSSCPGWKCPVLGGGNCLREDRVCDSHVDCYDAQDEANCTNWRKNSK